MMKLLIVVVALISMNGILQGHQLSKTLSTPPPDDSQANEVGKSANINAMTPKKSIEIAPLATDQIMNGQNRWKKGLYARLDRIRLACGELCAIRNQEDLENNQKRTSTSVVYSFPPLQPTQVNCQALFATDDIDVADRSVPFPIPDELVPYFSLQGIVEITRYRHAPLRNIYLGKTAKVNTWPEAYVNEWVDQAKTGNLTGNYSVRFARMIHSKLKGGGSEGRNVVEGKSIMVIGSENPWVEAIILSLGATKVTTLEFGTIVSEHPQIVTMTPDIFRASYIDGTLEKYDGVVSFSSLEHAGLGRYGDSLNPWADILSIARSWCVVKADGFLALGIPTGKDQIEFNAHRIYGQARWSIMTRNWKQIDGDDHTFSEYDFMGVGADQPVFLFRREAA